MDTLELGTCWRPQSTETGRVSELCVLSGCSRGALPSPGSSGQGHWPCPGTSAGVWEGGDRDRCNFQSCLWGCGLPRHFTAAAYSKPNREKQETETGLQAEVEMWTVTERWPEGERSRELHTDKFFLRRSSSQELSHSTGS